ncbi:hypothetical protein [Devosia epidermidihirudinis]|uniref:hypothetical protein n=1 Tax=Devosia epidermidihirudinis TaxID=1293439 RepID=UPI000696C5CB|nr:hypothetical protein [Devosia epidermidihirudinis]
MSVTDHLAGALDRRDEGPNVALAEDIAARDDKAAIIELAEAVRNGTNRQRADAIKVLYEIGARRPELIGGECPLFFEALGSANNRLVWGAMTALDEVADQRADELVAQLPRIIAAADKGSVIAKDRCTSLLVKLAKAGYADKAVPLLVERLRTAAPNQFPTYAEKTAEVITPEAKPGFIAVLKARFADMAQKSKRDRVTKVLEKMNG